MTISTNPPVNSDLDRVEVSPVGVHAPYRVAPDTYVIPQLVGAPPGAFGASTALVRGGKERVIVETGTEPPRAASMRAAFSAVHPPDVWWSLLSHHDHGHRRNLTAVLDECPRAPLVTNRFTVV